MFTLRPYQTDTIGDVFDSYNNGIRRQLVVLATGLGKTVIATQLVEKFRTFFSSKNIHPKALFLVDQVELVDQAAASMKKAMPDLVVGIEQANRKIRRDSDIVVACVPTIGRENSQRILKFNPDEYGLIICDETHKAVSKTWLNVLNYFAVGPDNQAPDKLLIGLSVGPDSYVELKGDIYGDGWVGKIEDAYNLAFEAYDYYKYQTYDIVELNGVYSRGWTGKSFDWKPVKKMIRHACTKSCKQITVGGDKLTLTNDHSVFKLENGELIESMSEELNVKDVTLFDSGYENNGDQEINVLDYLHDHPAGNKIKVCVDHSHITNEQWRDFGIYSQKRYDLRNGINGMYLPLDLYLKIKDILPEPTKIYWETCSGMWINPTFKLSDLAYIIGFYYGDGWLSKTRLSFAVENKLVDSFTHELDTLDFIKLNYKVCNCKGNSKEIRVSHTILLHILKVILGIDKCDQKSVLSSIITTWTKEKRLELIQGMIDSDGHISKRSRNRVRYYYVTTSKSLAKSLHSLLRSIGVKASINQQKPNKAGVIDGRQIIGKKTRYTVNWSKQAMLGNHEGNNGYHSHLLPNDWNAIQAPIQKIHDVKSPEFVYDFEMSGHPSFVANGILVHNTATPNRTDGVKLGKIFDDITVNYDLSWGIRNGWLTDIEVYNVKTNTDISNVKTVGDDFAKGELSEAVNNAQRNAQIVQAYTQYAQGQRAFVYTASVEHAYELEALFKANNVSCGVIEANTDKVLRKQMLAKHKSGEGYNVLLNYGTLTTGVDSPKTSVCVIARPIKSELIYRQIIGRVLRPDPSAKVDDYHQLPDARKFLIECSDKPAAKVIDFEDVTGKHQTMSVPSLFGLTRKIAEDKPRFHKDVVEVIEAKEHELGFDLKHVESMQEIELIVERREGRLGSLETPREITSYTDMAWMEMGPDHYELTLSSSNASMIIVKNKLDQFEARVYDHKKQETFKLQSFKNLSGAFNLADRYAKEHYDTAYQNNKAEWRGQGVTAKQAQILARLLKGGLRTDPEKRYPDTGVPMLTYQGEILTRGTASNLMNTLFSRK